MKMESQGKRLDLSLSNLPLGDECMHPPWAPWGQPWGGGWLHLLEGEQPGAPRKPGLVPRELLVGLCQPVHLVAAAGHQAGAVHQPWVSSQLTCLLIYPVNLVGTTSLGSSPPIHMIRKWDQSSCLQAVSVSPFELSGDTEVSLKEQVGIIVKEVSVWSPQSHQGSFS